MREKIILQDFTVLLICTSDKWSTIERRVIFDSTFLRNMGCNPVILCRKNSQIDIAAEIEDIPRIYIHKNKLDFGLQFLLELRTLVREKRYNLFHCYSLASTWAVSLVLKPHQKIPLFFTLNQNINSFYNNLIAKWLLRRLDYIFTLSNEVKEFVEETFPIHKRKVKNLGSGVEILKSKEIVCTELDSENINQVQDIGCVINNLNELKRLKYLIKVFRVLKGHGKDKFNHLKLHVFLGPRIYQKDRAKLVLTELDYEFYEGDILLLSLESKGHELKKLDVFIGTAFDEPLNDYEVIAMMNEIPVLFPRTAMRQNLIFKYAWIGESYFEGDIREARTKLTKIITNYSVYKNSLEELSEEISEAHGLEVYATELQKYYETAFAKRMKRFSKVK